jgi:hypothetical protein
MAYPEYKRQYHLKNWYICDILLSVTSQKTFTTVRSLNLTSYLFIRLLCNAPTLTCLNLMFQVCLSMYEYIIYLQFYDLQSVIQHFKLQYNNTSFLRRHKFFP